MILISGGTGTVGSEVVKQLQATGAKFRLLARNPKKAFGHPDVEIVQGDLGDAATLEKALKGVDKLFLLTNSSPDSVQLQNKAMDAAKKAGVNHVVRLSVSGADPASPVQISKWHAANDAYLKGTGMKWTILQPGYFMQNTLASASTIKKDGAFYGMAGEGKMAAIDARDIGAAAVKALSTSGHEGKTYVLSGKEAISFGDIAARLSKVLGKSVKYVNLEAQQFKGALLSAGLPEWLAKDYVTMQGFQASGGMAGVDPTLGKLIGNVRTYDDFLATNSGAFK